MESHEMFQEIKELFRETDRRMAETDRRMAETDRRMAETDRRMRQTDLQIKQLGKQIGGLGNRLGEFVEGLVKPGLVGLFRRRGIDVRETHQDLEVERNGKSCEVDLLVVNDDEVVVVEVKSKLSDRDVHDHLERLELFKELFPRYADARVYGAMAAMVIPKKQADFAERQGLFVIGQRGDYAALLNHEQFEPRTW